MSTIFDSYFRFYMFSYQTFSFLYYISFSIVGLAYVFHTFFIFISYSFNNQQSSYSNAVRKNDIL